MKKISAKEKALIAELNAALEKLTDNLYALLDDVVNVRLEQKDGYSAHVKNQSAHLIEKAKNRDG